VGELRILKQKACKVLGIVPTSVERIRSGLKNRAAMFDLESARHSTPW
jgi:hypothetical protein